MNSPIDNTIEPGTPPPDMSTNPFIRLFETPFNLASGPAIDPSTSYIPVNLGYKMAYAEDDLPYANDPKQIEQ
ncbi:hypothetical protein FRC06_004360 [Ceratobasidium sp. 370]|nr:hypothetical protein FRC06_004360 [Ceratobasidium sp. 370]